MKPNHQSDFGQATGTNGSLVGTNNHFIFKIHKYPYVFLVICWFAYTVLDVSTSLKLGLEFSWEFGLINLTFALLISAILLYWFFPGMKNLRSNGIKAFLAFFSLLFAIHLKIEVQNALELSIASLTYQWISESIRLFHYSVIVFLVWVLKITAEYLYAIINGEIYAKNLLLRNQSLKLPTHFFLNVFNGIRGKSAGISKELFEDLTHLNNFLRYYLYNDKDDDSLVFEIDIVKSFLHLQHVRFGKTMFFESVIQIDDQLILKDFFFPKTALLNLVDNIFKHGDLTKKDKPATIQIALTMNPVTSEVTFLFNCENLKNLEKHQPDGGLAQTTVKELLNFSLPKNKWVEVNSKDTYRLSLTIKYSKNDSGSYS